MENGWQKEIMTNLGSLPESSDKYWDGSDKVYVENIPVNKDCQHNFLLVKANEAKCKICHFGLFLTGADRVDNGHIYNEDGLVI